MKEERSNAAVVSTTIATFIFGGSESKDTFEYLEKNASDWKLGTAYIPDSFRTGCSVANSHDEIWLIGGSGNKGRNGGRILSFDLTNQIFKKLHIKLDQGRYGHQCAFVPGTRHLMITGGYSNDNYRETTEIIDVDNRNVTEGPSMNSKRCYHGIGVLNIEGHEKIIVLGGTERYLSTLKSVEMYNAQTQKWEFTNIELSEAKEEFGFMTIKSQP